MATITSIKDLNARILELQLQEEQQTLILKAHLSETMQSLRPSSLVKNAVGDIASSPEIRQNVVDTTLSMGAGWVARKIVGFNSKSMLSKLAGLLIQKAVTKMAAKKISKLRHG